MPFERWVPEGAVMSERVSALKNRWHRLMLRILDGLRTEEDPRIQHSGGPKEVTGPCQIHSSIPFESNIASSHCPMGSSSSTIQRQDIPILIPFAKTFSSDYPNNDVRGSQFLKLVPLCVLCRLSPTRGLLNPAFGNADVFTYDVP
jgi:hypothetical protein